MKKKTVMYTETAYVLGVVILALGTAFMAPHSCRPYS